MPSKSRVVTDQRKTEEIIQAYGHEVTPASLALFNGVFPERILPTPSFDTGAQAARLSPLNLPEAKIGEAIVSSPIDGTAPLDYNKSRDSKPGGLNSAQTKHELSIVTALEAAQPPDPEAPIDAGTFLSPDIIPSVSPQGVPLRTAEEAKAQAAAAKAPPPPPPSATSKK